MIVSNITKKSDLKKFFSFSIWLYNKFDLYCNTKVLTIGMSVNSMFEEVIDWIALKKTYIMYRNRFWNITVSQS